MAIFDIARRSIFLKIVYYGCALCGKTTNLKTLHRLTDPGSRQGMVSIATKADRTLFFDMIPLALGQIGGLTVRVKVYTVPGQVHYEVTRRQVLAGADGVVVVIDSTPEMRESNTWALKNLRMNLERNRLDPKTPIVVQWNKRDVPQPVPVTRLEAELNPEKLPSFQAIATQGDGVIETFSTVAKLAIQHACLKAGRPPVSEHELADTVDRALARHAPASSSEVETESEAVFEHRFDAESYRDQWAEQGRDRQIIDQETLLSEAVQTSMELAERLDGYRETQELGAKLTAMFETHGALAAELCAPDGPPLPASLMARALRAAGRSKGSLLFAKGQEQVLDEREVVPAGSDPLNHAVPGGIGSAAWRLSRGDRPRLVDDLAGEVFFNAVPPGALDLARCYIAPVICDRVGFGAIFVYGCGQEPPFTPAEEAYWSSLGLLLGLSLHWRGLKRKLTAATPT